MECGAPRNAMQNTLLSQGGPRSNDGTLSPSSEGGGFLKSQYRPSPAAPAIPHIRYGLDASGVEPGGGVEARGEEEAGRSVDADVDADAGPGAWGALPAPGTVRPGVKSEKARVREMRRATWWARNMAGSTREKMSGAADSARLSLSLHTYAPPFSCGCLGFLTHNVPLKFKQSPPTRPPRTAAGPPSG